MRGRTSRLRSFWGGCWNEPVAVPARWQEGSRCAFLMASTRGRLLFLGGNPLHGSDALDSRMGACLWDLSLGQRTGDGDMMGRRFWVGRGCFFSGGGGGGKRDSRERAVETFSQDDASSKQPWVLCYILYVEQWRFRCCMLQAVAKSALDPRCPGQRTCAVRASTVRRLSSH